MFSARELGGRPGQQALGATRMELGLAGAREPRDGDQRLAGQRLARTPVGDGQADVVATALTADAIQAGRQFND
jgi:hypothetical protein